MVTVKLTLTVKELNILSNSLGFAHGALLGLRTFENEGRVQDCAEVLDSAITTWNSIVDKAEVVETKVNIPSM